MSLCNSYQPNYFSIIDILATEERLQCTLMLDLPLLGCLDPACESGDLKAGTKLELPYWLVNPLNLNNLRNHRIPQIVAIEDIPKIYKEAYRDILEADATAFNLSNWNQYYYEFGMHLRELDNSECDKITEILNKIFQHRFRSIADWVQNPVAESSRESQLPVLERELYLAGKKANLQLKNWMERGVSKIETSEIVANMRKRKRIDFEIN